MLKAKSAVSSIFLHFSYCCYQGGSSFCMNSISIPPVGFSPTGDANCEQRRAGSAPSTARDHPAQHRQQREKPSSAVSRAASVNITEHSGEHTLPSPHAPASHCVGLDGNEHPRLTVSTPPVD